MEDLQTFRMFDGHVHQGGDPFFDAMDKGVFLFFEKHPAARADLADHVVHEFGVS